MRVKARNSQRRATRLRGSQPFSEGAVRSGAPQLIRRKQGVRVWLQASPGCISSNPSGSLSRFQVIEQLTQIGQRYCLAATAGLPVCSPIDHGPGGNSWNELGDPVERVEGV